jgi:hypothetical protein
MGRLLFASSFARDMYAASGAGLVRSFHEHQQGDVLLLGLEGMTLPRAIGLVHADLDKDQFLQGWLRANRDVIPDYLGGTARICKCKDRHQMHGKHLDNPGCHWQWMNRNASRWFRKVATLRLAVREAADWNSRILVWLDSDSEIIRPATEQALLDVLGGKGVAYCKGHRPAVEAGVVLYDLEAGGREYIDALCKSYESRKYLRHKRWDDGYQMAVLGNSGKFEVRDLVHPTRYRGKTNDVIPTTPLAGYFVHNKGRHGRGLGIMK